MSTHHHWYADPQVVTEFDPDQPTPSKSLYIETVNDEDCDGSYEAEMKRIAVSLVNGLQ